jgi:Rhs element Vgr protein
MALSRSKSTGHDLVVQLQIGGATVPKTHRVLSADIWLALNRVGRAMLRIRDDSTDAGCFAISSSPLYVPGAELALLLGYGTMDSCIFKGIIISHGLAVSADEGPSLQLEAADPAVAMTTGRRSALYSNLTDSQLIENLLSNYKLKGSVTSTSEQHHVIIQHSASDWDLMLMRAEMNAMVVACEQGVITISPPNTNMNPELELTYGESILSAKLSLNAWTQLPADGVQSVAWDPANLAIASSNEAQSSIHELGNLSGQQLAEVLACNKAYQQTAASLSPAELTSWSAATLQRHQLAKVRGQVTCVGTAEARIGTAVKLTGLGDRFNGNAYVSGVYHRVQAGKWSTELEIGLSPEPFASSTEGISPPPAGGQLPAVGMIQIGIVSKCDGDPDNQYRLQIQLPLVQKDNNLIWARLAHPYASAECGFQFLPEVGDEVLVAFMEGDPRFPVVLGSLYSKKHAPAQAPTAENNLKSLVTKAKLRLDFDEEAKAIKLTTPAKQMLTIDDKAKQLKLEDCNGNSISLSDSGIILNSSGDIKLEAKGSIQLSASTNLTAKGGTKLELSAPQGEFNADSKLTLKGGAQAQLTAGASVVVQAAMVKIN